MLWVTRAGGTALSSSVTATPVTAASRATNAGSTGCAAATVPSAAPVVSRNSTRTTSAPTGPPNGADAAQSRQGAGGAFGVAWLTRPVTSVTCTAAARPRLTTWAATPAWSVVTATASAAARSCWQSASIEVRTAAAATANRSVARLRSTAATVAATKAPPSRTGPNVTARKAAVNRPRSVNTCPRKLRPSPAMLTQSNRDSGVA